MTGDDQIAGTGGRGVCPAFRADIMANCGVRKMVFGNGESPIPLAPFGCGRDEIVHPGHSRFVICGIV